MNSMAYRSISNESVKKGVPFFLADHSGDFVVRGRAKWISKDEAYVLVPYGTATESRQEWEATVIASGEDRQADPPAEQHLSVQLIAADQCVGTEEDEAEGLLLRLLGPGTTTLSAHRLEA